MFQHLWFDQVRWTASGQSDPPDISALPSYDEEIAYVRVADWQEHCVECGPPLCYQSCENFLPRIDRRCKNFFYGIRRINVHGQSAAELTFRRWGKLETWIYPATVSPQTDRILDHVNYIVSSVVRGISSALRPLFPRYPLCNLYTIFSIRVWRRYFRPPNRETDCFLFHCYSYEPDECKLLLDIVSEKAPFRKSLSLSPGENNIQIDVPPACTEKGDLVRIYPENDREVHIAILFSGFVKRRKTGREDRPAEKVKCVVWDLDNTIWQGTLIESDPSELVLLPGIREALEALDQRGILNSIASKNTHQDAALVLKSLGIWDLFVHPAICWGSKSKSLNEIADALNINLNTFLLIDDSPAERAEVAESLPQVRVYDETIVPQLLHLDEIDVTITAESSARRQMYLTETRRNVFSQGFGADNIAFLRRCHISISLSCPTSADQLLRCYDLIQRTNQLNLSAVKYTQEQFRVMQECEGNHLVTATCQDRFGAYGQILFLVFQIEGQDIRVIELAMSCRVASKYVESALLCWLRQQLPVPTEGKVVFVGNQTEKNRLLVQALTKSGMRDIHQTDGQILLELSDVDEIYNPDVVEVCSE